MFVASQSCSHVVLGEHSLPPDVESRMGGCPCLFVCSKLESLPEAHLSPTSCRHPIARSPAASQDQVLYQC